MNASKRILALAVLVTAHGSLVTSAPAQNPIHVTYQWHMHQPIYYPYESVQATDGAGRFAFSVAGVHGERAGNYGDWPKNAVQQGADRGMPHAGVQVSFSGSLMENLNGLWGTGWREHWRWARNGLRTTRNNPRLDLVGFAYHHSLMPLTSYESMRMQIRLHREAYKDNWDTGGTYSKGFFPPESSFATHMIPALVAEGIEWVMVDSGHFDRTLEDFPWNSASSIRPNRSEFRNGTAADKASQWVQLQNVWAPTPVAAPFSYQPHRVRYVDPHSDPANPTVHSMIAVPAARYEGNENGRGGYGAFKPENVWGSQVDKNNNPARPMLILCHSDGDNFGMKNADAFHGQHGNFLNMIQSNPNFEHTTVQDYLELYPVPGNDYIHVESGSWVGIDGGTPYYDKWVENNARDGQHPDYWSWSVVIAAQNRVLHADNLENNYSMNDIRWGIGPDTAKAWRYFLQSETSCHWYWDYDTANPWDGNATRAANLAVAEANKVIGRHPGVDNVGPSIFHPQRKIWNPGGKHWNEPQNQPSNFDVWTFADDVSGVASVTLKWRTADFNSYKNLGNYAHELYAHTPGQNSPWNSVPMSGDWYPAQRGPNVPEPANRAMRYTAQVQGATNTLVSYYIEAVDTKGNTNKSIILHVWVGDATGGPVNLPRVEFDPPAPTGCVPVTVKYRKSTSLVGTGPVHIHIGRNGWQGTILPNPPMTDSGDFWTYVYNTPAETESIQVAFNNGGSTWDSNSGANWQVSVAGCSTGGGGGPVQTAWINPAQPDGCGPVTVYYNPAGRPLATATQVFAHIGRDDGTGRWKDVVTPTPAMTLATGIWSYVYTPPPGTREINVVFNNGAGAWDNNANLDWHFAVTNCAGAPPPPDGFAITNPPSSMIVGSGETAIDLQGIASGVTGHLAWTNPLTGGAGTIPAASPWTVPGVALGVGTNVLTVRGSNVVAGGIATTAQDSAANYGGVWNNGSSQGAGFLPWQLSSDASAGSFLGANGFGLWAHAGNLSAAVRPFAAALGSGNVFRVTLKNGDVHIGNPQGIGMALRTGAGADVIQFFFNGGDANYQLSDAAEARSTGIGWTSAPQPVELQFLSATSYLFKAAGVTITGAYNGVIAQVRFWNWNGSNGSNFDFYFDHLRVLADAAPSVTHTNASVTLVRPASNADSNGDGIPDAWYQQHGLDHAIPNMAASNIPNRDLTYREAYLYDLNPTNPPGQNPNLVRPVAGPGVMQLRIEPSSANRRYDVFWTTSLVGEAWTPMGYNVPGHADQAPVDLVVTNTGELRFYRTGARLP